MMNTYHGTKIDIMQMIKQNQTKEVIKITVITINIMIIEEIHEKKETPEILEIPGKQEKPEKQEIRANHEIKNTGEKAVPQVPINSKSHQRNNYVIF